HLIDGTGIYCPTTKGAIMTAEFIINNIKNLSQYDYNLELDDVNLTNCVRKGVGYYHSNLTQSDKERVLDAYKEGHIKYIVLTQCRVSIKSNLIIMKSTKKYTNEGYCECTPLELADIFLNITKKGKIIIMTTNEMVKYYKNIFVKKKKISNDDFTHNNKKNQLTNFNFTPLENHIPEYVLFHIFSKNEKICDIKISLCRSFFYYMLGDKASDFQTNVLIGEVISFLQLKRFIFNENCYNYDLYNIYCISKLSLDNFIFLTELNGDEESVALQIVKLCKSYFKSKDKKQMFHKNLNKRKSNIEDLLLKEFKEKLNIYIEIMRIVKTYLSTPLILLSKVNSDKTCFYLNNNVNKDQNSIQNDSIKICVTENKLYFTSKINTYYIIVESKGTVLYAQSKILSDTVKIDVDLYEVYAINTCNWLLSVVIKIENGKLLLHEKFYGPIMKFKKMNKCSAKKIKTADKLMTNVPNTLQNKYFNDIEIELKKNACQLNAQKTYKVYKETKNINGVRFTHYIPRKITLPEWFINKQ
ncbi:ATP-dependent DNA helicase MER3, partial [Conglomerata obtusa]